MPLRCHRVAGHCRDAARRDFAVPLLLFFEGSGLGRPAIDTPDYLIYASGACIADTRRHEAATTIR